MPVKAHKKLLQATYDEKKRYKMYKVGRNWTVAGLAFVFSGLLLTQQPDSVAAATEATTDAAATKAPAANTAAKLVPTPTTVLTIGTQTIKSGETAAFPKVTMTAGEQAPKWTLEDFDFSKVDKTTAGTYAVTLSKAGLAALQAANPAQNITAETVKDGQVTVAAADAKASDAAATDKTPAATTDDAKAAAQTEADASKTASDDKATDEDAAKTSADAAKATDDDKQTTDAATSDAKAADQTSDDATNATTDDAISVAKASDTKAATAEDAAQTDDDATKAASDDKTAETDAVASDTNAAATDKAADQTEDDATKAADDAIKSATDATASDDKAASADAANTKAPAVEYKEADNPLVHWDDTKKVNLTLSTDKIGYNSGAKTLVVTLNMATSGDETVSVTLPTDSPILNWDNFAALPAGVGTGKAVKNADGTTTYTITAPGGVTINQDLTLKLADNQSQNSAIIRPISAEYIGTKNLQIKWSVNGKEQTPIELPQTIQPSAALTTPVRQHPSTTAIPKLVNGTEVLYAFNVAESTGVLDSTNVQAVSKWINSAGAKITIPVPKGFQLDQAATDIYNQFKDGTTITQPDGASGDIIITVPAGQGGPGSGTKNWSDPYFLIGAYTGTQPAEDTTVKADGPAVFEQKLDNGKTLTWTGKVWQDDLSGTGTGQISPEIELRVDGNSSTSTEVLLVDDDVTNDPKYLSSVDFTLNAPAALNNSSFTFSVPDGITATGIKVPDPGSGYFIYMPGTTSYAYTLKMKDGSEETGTVAPGGTIEAKNTSGIVTAVLKPNHLDAGAYTIRAVLAENWSERFLLYGTVDKTYADGTPLKVGDKLTFSVAFNDGLAKSTTTNGSRIETIAAPIGNTIGWTKQTSKNPGEPSGSMSIKANGGSGQTTDKLFEPIVYFIAPSNASVAGYLIPAGSKAVITKYTTDDGRTGVKMDFTGTGESVSTTTTGVYGLNLENSLDSTASESSVDYYITSPNTALKQTKKVTDLSLTDGDANAVQMDDAQQPWSVIAAKVQAGITLAQGNQNPDPVVDATSDVHDDGTVIFNYNLLNSSNTSIEGSSTILNLATAGQGGSTATYHLTEPITVPATSSKGVAYTPKIMYSTSTYTPADGQTTPDLTNFVTEDQISDWSSVRAVYVSFGKVAAGDSTGRITLTGTVDDFVKQNGKVAKLDALTFMNGAAYNESTSANVSMSSTSTLTAVLRYTDADGVHNIALDDLTQVLKDGVDTLHVPKLSDTDMALIPKDYVAGAVEIENSDANYGDIPNNTAVDGQVSQYDFDGDVIVYNYAKDEPVTTQTIKKTVHYTDQGGDKLVDDYSKSVEVSDAVDPKTGVPAPATLPGQANPTVDGYHVIKNPADATGDSTVSFGDKDIDVTVIYAANSLTQSLNSVTKTIHFVDENGDTLKPDYTAQANFTKVVDDQTGDVSYGPETATLGHPEAQTLEIPGYTLTNTPKEATTDQTVKYGDKNIEVTLVYKANSLTQSLSSVTKTIHFVDENGDKLKDDFTAQANFTKVVDDQTGDVSYGPETATLSHPDAQTLEIPGYTLTNTPKEATTDQTVKYGDKNIEVTLVYKANSLTQSLNSVTKTIHFVDENGDTLKPDYTAQANFTKVVDDQTGDVSYGPETATLGHPDAQTLEIPGYTLTNTPKEATDDQTVKYGDKNIEVTLVYKANSLTQSLNSVTKTIHFVDENGDTLKDDYTAQANFTKVVDDQTGDVSYGPETGTLSHPDAQTLEIPGYTLTNTPKEATTDQTVKYGDKNIEVTLVYKANSLTQSLNSVTKTIHFVDEKGDTLKPDYTAQANFTKVVDKQTGDASYGPETATLGHPEAQTLEIPGFTLTNTPKEATTDQTVKYGDKNIEVTLVYKANSLKQSLDTVTKTVKYVDEKGNELKPAFTAHANFTQVVDDVAGTTDSAPRTATLGFKDNPEIAGYSVANSPEAATSAQTVKYGDQDINVSVVYTKNPTTMTLSTVTKTVHYVDQYGKTLAPDFTAHANFTELHDQKTNASQYAPETATLGHQDNPEFEGYTITQNPAEATTDQTVSYGAKNEEYTVVYTKNPTTMTLNTVTKTVHYVDQYGKSLAPDFTAHANFTELHDEKANTSQYAPETATLGHQDNPEFEGYTITQNPAEAATDQTVSYGAKNEEYTVVYTKNPTTMTLNTVTKTVHYVDQYGKTLAPDFTAHANFTELHDQKTNASQYAPETATLGHQDNPEFKGYTITQNPAEATTDQTVSYGAKNEEYTVVYTKNPATTTLDTVTKTVHYVDEDGQTLAPDFTAHANFTQLHDATTGTAEYGPETALLGHQDVPTVKGYTAQTIPTEATTDQTVKFGDPDQTYNVVYTKNPTTTTKDTITKTVRYVDETGHSLTAAFTDKVTLNKVTDTITKEATYTPKTATLGHQANPEIPGYTLKSTPQAAVTDQTVKFGDPDTTYDVVYTKNATTQTQATVTKTVHYVDQDGNQLAADFTDHANFTALHDAVTDTTQYGPASATLGYQADPTFAGFTKVTSPAGATSSQTVHYGDADLEYTVVYNRNTPTQALDTVTKTVHYVDQNGIQLAADFTDHANFTALTDAVDGAVTYGPESATLGYQNDPIIAGYHVESSPAAATSKQTVSFGDDDLEYTVIYVRDQPSNNGGETTPPDNNGGETTPPDNNGGQTTPPDNNGGETTPPDNNGGETTPPDNNGGQTTPPDNNGGETTPPDNNGGETTPPDNNGGETTPPDNNGGQTTPPDNNGGETTPPDNNSGQTTPPDNNGGETTPPDNNGGETTPPDNNGGETTPPDNNGGETTPPDNNGGQTTPPDNNGSETATPNNNGGESTTPNNTNGQTTPPDTNGEQTTTSTNTNGETTPASTPDRHSLPDTNVGDTATPTQAPSPSDQPALSAQPAQPAAKLTKQTQSVGSRRAAKQAATRRSLPATGESQNVLAMLGMGLVSLIGATLFRRKRN
ncbi:mucin-binding protein [Lacticaseibacillus jixiensis]|uniref:mucin-binding protein n=1 Tax=Lacticaseibacillus jixiensis TaxID=3231926 RepID=UPI0036F3D22A